MPFGGGLLAGAGVVSNIIGGIAGKEAGQGDIEAGKSAITDAFNQLKNIGLPPDEAKAIVYQKFQQAGLMTPALEQHIDQQASQMGQIQEDPKLKEAQMNALQILSQRGKGGLTPEDRAALNQIRNQIATDTEAKRQQILQNFQARGQAGGGAELIAALQGAQSGANAESQEGDRLAAMASQNALQAIGQAGTLGGQIRGQEFGQEAQKAQAQDVINQFNVANQVGQQARNVQAQNVAQAQNIAGAQNVSNLNVQQANQELLRQREAQRQQYLDTLNRAQAINQAAQGYGSKMSDYGQQASKQAAAPWQAIGAGASTIGTSMMNMGAQDEWGGDSGKGTTAPRTTNAYDNIFQAAEGGEVPEKSFAEKLGAYFSDKPVEQQKVDPNKAKSFSDSFKAATYADGGEVESDPEIDRLRKIFPTMSEENLRDLHARASSPEKYVQPVNVQSPMSGGSGSPVDKNPYVNTAKILTAQGYGFGGPISPSLHQRRMPVTDYRSGGHVPGPEVVPGDSPSNDIVDAKLSPGEYVIKKSKAQSPFGKKLIKLLEAHHEVMKHDKGE